MKFSGDRSASLAIEISAAVFRVAALVRHKRLREELEEAAIMLVKFLNEESALRLGRLIGLAEAIEEINGINAEVLLRELDNFLVAPRDLRIPDVLRIKGGQFSKRRLPKTEERHAAILDFVRRFPDCCPVDHLFLEFAFVSPRTLRRDLEDLTRRGFLKKQGNLLVQQT